MGNAARPAPGYTFQPLQALSCPIMPDRICAMGLTEFLIFVPGAFQKAFEIIQDQMHGVGMYRPLTMFGPITQTTVQYYG